jgi:hypothetical protein
MDALESSPPTISDSKVEEVEIELENGMNAPMSDPVSSNFESVSADATTDGFDGGTPNEALLDDSGTENGYSRALGSVDDLDDEKLLEMIKNGELEYSIEEDPEYEAEGGDMAPIEFLCENIMPITTPSEDSSSPSKKRVAVNDIDLEREGHVDKKPKLEDLPPSDAQHQTSPIPNPEPSSNKMDVDNLSIMPSLPKETPQILPIIQTPSVAPTKTSSRSRSSSNTVYTPLSIVTRTRALSAANAGAEIIVPEHSHSIPKWMPRAPVRAIEIPVWSIRETYEEEEDIRAQYQAKLFPTLNSSETSSNSTSTLKDLENRFFDLAKTTSSEKNGEIHELNGNKTNGGPSPNETEEEVVGDDKYYAVRHYRYEIKERLRWETGPGSDRFKKEDRFMTVEQFRSHALWPTYFNAPKGRLLPQEKWAQNMVHTRPRTIRRDKAKTTAAGQTSANGPKISAPIIIPKGFVLKIKSVTGTTVVRTNPSTSAIGSSSSASTTMVGARTNHPSKPSTTTPSKPIVKKAGTTLVAVSQMAAPTAKIPTTLSPTPIPSLPAITPPLTLPPPPPPPPPPPSQAAPPPKAPAKLLIKFGSKTFSSKHPTSTNDTNNSQTTQQAQSSSIAPIILNPKTQTPSK